MRPSSGWRRWRAVESPCYEADTNPNAKTGGDLLDIRGKVTAVDVLSEEDAATVLGAIDEESAVSQFVEAVLASPVDQEGGDHEGERYFLGFRLADGTSVVRSFWMDSGDLSRGIITDPTVATSVRRALSNEESTQAAKRPVPWGGGTGIMLPQAVEQGLAAQPSPDWDLMNVPGWASQPGFSLRLPLGWEAKETWGIDSYVGEVAGDGMLLRFDYGGFSSSLDPADDPEHSYTVTYEEIGVFEARLVTLVDASGGLTGVHFSRMDGPSLTLYGVDLTPQQQNTAFAIFRTIRSGNIDAGRTIAAQSAAMPTPIVRFDVAEAVTPTPTDVRCVSTGTPTPTPRPEQRRPDTPTDPGAARPYYGPSLDVDYDDSWVENIPSTIGGYKVRYINTPKSRACSKLPLISLQIPRDSTKSSTRVLGVQALKEELRSIPGVPHNIRLSFTPRKFDPVEKANKDKENNAHSLEHGCIRLGGPIELKDDSGG